MLVNKRNLTSLYLLDIIEEKWELVIMVLTISVRDSALDKVLTFINNFQQEITIISQQKSANTDIDIIAEDHPDYGYIQQGRKERQEHPENYGTLDDIKWN